MTLVIAGTSFLLPGHAAWRVLAPADALDFAEYGAWASSLLAAPAEAPVIVVAFLADLLEGLADGDASARLDPLLGALDARLARATAPTLIAFASGETPSPIRSSRRAPPTARAAADLGDALYRRAAEAPGLHLVPLDPVLARIGTDKAYDARNFYAARCRLSSAGLAAAAGAVAAVLARAQGPARKLLVLDCDDTLWGGVLGEVGLGGVVLGLDGIGQAFRDFQAAAKDLARDGVLLALSSKNDEADVRAMFKSHPGMALTEDDIAAWRIGWGEKADSIAGLAADLDIGLDAVVFWDDNPLEREKIRRLLPEVLTVEPPAEVTAWPLALRRLDALALAEPTAEDRRKTAQYRARAAFIGDKALAAAEADFLAAIAMRPSAVALDAASLPRAAQLLAKTNQFNLTGRRHGAAELAAMIESGRIEGFLARLIDRYGDHGLIGLALAEIDEAAGIARLDSFAMSCRVLGRHVEAWVLAALARRLGARGVSLLVADFVPSARNQVAASFLPGHGFIAEADWAPAWRDRCAALPPAAGPRYALPLEGAVIPFQEYFADADAS